MARSSRLLAAILVTGVAGAIVTASSVASAWCRTTTTQDFVSSPAKPCDDTGRPLFWSSKCVGYSLQRDASPAQVPFDAARTVARLAFGEWSSHGCPSDPVACTGPIGAPPISVTDVGPVTCDQVEYNQGSGNANIVVFRDADWNILHCDRKTDPQCKNGNADVTLALTTVTFNPDTGEILDADMEINSDPHYNHITTGDTRVAYDLQSIMTHEAGHFLGLAHTQPQNSNSTMYLRYQKGKTFMRHLSKDDVCGICAAYDPRRSTVCDNTPRRGLALTCGGGDLPASKGCGCEVVGGGSAGSLFAVGLAAIACAIGMARRRIKS